MPIYHWSTLQILSTHTELIFNWTKTRKVSSLICHWKNPLNPTLYEFSLIIVVQSGLISAKVVVV